MLAAVRNLGQLFQTATANLRLLQKRTSAISGPPSRTLSMGERVIHYGVMTTAFLIVPFIFYPNLKKIRGVTEEKQDDHDETEDDD